MMFRWINKHPEYKSLKIYAVTMKISMTEYHHSTTAELMVYSNTTVGGGGGGGGGGGVW